MGRNNNAVIAQLVEHWLPKPRVAGSSPVYRSKGVMVAMSMVAISLLEWITRTRDPINKESAACCAGSLQAKRQADYESRLPLNRKRPYGCFHVFFSKIFHFSLDSSLWAYINFVLVSK